MVDIFDSPENSLILIDELEVGFYPDIQRKLANVIKYVSWHHKKQFILTTHSPTLLSAFSPKSRRFLEKQEDGTIKEKRRISVNAAFSKMDSNAYPLIHLYCEDDVASFIVTSLLALISKRFPSFNKLINIIKSGSDEQVKKDYQTHKRNYSQYRIKVGYACVFDGDCQRKKDFSEVVDCNEDFAFFLYPYDVPEKILARSFIKEYPNEELEAYLTYIDHHKIFWKISELGLATSREHGLMLCWESFRKTEDFQTLERQFEDFILKATKHFSDVSDI